MYHWPLFTNPSEMFKCIIMKMYKGSSLDASFVCIKTSFKGFSQPTTVLTHWLVSLLTHIYWIVFWLQFSNCRNKFFCSENYGAPFRLMQTHLKYLKCRPWQNIRLSPKSVPFSSFFLQISWSLSFPVSFLRLLSQLLYFSLSSTNGKKKNDCFVEILFQAHVMASENSI